jgi:hypothetical protein
VGLFEDGDFSEMLSVLSSAAPRTAASGSSIPDSSQSAIKTCSEQRGASSSLAASWSSFLPEVHPKDRRRTLGRALWAGGRERSLSCENEDVSTSTL